MRDHEGDDREGPEADARHERRRPRRRRARRRVGVTRRQPVVYLISGPTAAGKTTVARLLAARFERGVHLEGDLFRRGIVGGGEEMSPDASGEALEQLRLAAAAADAYVDAGFSVVLEDVVAGRLLGDYRALIRSRPCHVIVLLPPAATADKHYDLFAGTTPRVGIWLDTSDVTPEQAVELILAQTSSTRAPIVVADYDDGWPTAFGELARSLRAAVADLGAVVEHVGSTAVPGLAAKPIVDVDVVVSSPDDVPAAIERLRSLGYVYQGDKGVAGREAFLWPPDTRPHHVYVVVARSKPHADHVDFRDYLREHPDVASDYATLKKELAQRYRDDAVGYTNAKDEFVARVLRAARAR